MRAGIRSAVSIAVVTFAVALTAGCASAPETPTPAAASVATTRVTATRTSKKSDGSRYQPIVKNGQTYYCAQEEFVGSKVHKQVCLTETQYQAMLENKRQFIHDIQSQPLTQSAPSGSSGR